MGLARTSGGRWQRIVYGRFSTLARSVSRAARASSKLSAAFESVSKAESGIEQSTTMRARSPAAAPPTSGGGLHSVLMDAVSPGVSAPPMFSTVILCPYLQPVGFTWAANRRGVRSAHACAWRRVGRHTHRREHVQRVLAQLGRGGRAEKDARDRLTIDGECQPERNDDHKEAHGQSDRIAAERAGWRHW